MSFWKCVFDQRRWFRCTENFPVWPKFGVWGVTAKVLTANYYQVVSRFSGTIKEKEYQRLEISNSTYPGQLKLTNSLTLTGSHLLMTLETRNTGFGVHTFKFQHCFLLPCRLYKVVDLRRVAINGSELLPMWGRSDLLSHDDYLRAFTVAKKYWIQ